MRRAGWLALGGEILGPVAEFPAGPELSEAANSPTVVNLSEAALIYRCPPFPFCPRHLPTTKGRHEKIVPFDARTKYDNVPLGDAAPGRCIKR